MKKYKSICLCLILVIIIAFGGGCGSDDAKKEDIGMQSDSSEIAESYDIIKGELKDEEDSKVKGNPIVEEFTGTDFQFTRADTFIDSSGVEAAFNVPRNGYAIMTPSGASYGYIGMASNALEGSFKNAKGYGFGSTVDAIVASYNVGAENIYTDTVSSYFGFSSVDGVEFSLLTMTELQSVIQASQSQSNPTDLLTDYHTIALIKLTSDGNGMLGEYAIYHYCKDAEESKHDH